VQVLTIQSVIMGLQFLMLEPNPDDPLNKEVRAIRVAVVGDGIPEGGYGSGRGR
jgi:hypothetical protein